MSESEHNTFVKKLAYHAAPTLLGAKSSSLLSLSTEDQDVDGNIEYFNRKTAEKRIVCRILCRCKSRVLLLVCNDRLLEKRLADDNVRQLLCQYGYANCGNVCEYIAHLSERTSANGDFPHEIGAFLDYPIEDVTGFIENKGKNYKLCGLWKVYGNVENAERIFAGYNSCRSFLCKNDDIYAVICN